MNSILLNGTTYSSCNSINMIYFIFYFIIMNKKEEVLNKLHWMHLIKKWWKWWYNKDTWEKLVDIMRKYPYAYYYKFIAKFIKKEWYDFTFNKYDDIILRGKGWDVKRVSFEFYDEDNKLLVKIRSTTLLRACLLHKQDWMDTIDMCLLFKEKLCPRAVKAVEINYIGDKYEIDLT